MAGQQKVAGANPQDTTDPDELGEGEGSIVKGYAYCALALLVLAAILLIFLRFVLYLW